MRALYGGMMCLAACCALAGCGAAGSAQTSEEDASQQAAKDAPRLVPTAEAARAAEPFPLVVLRTSLGNITVKLDAEHAPATVANFLDLVQSGQYNETIFHEVEAGYVVLGGSYRQDLSEKKARYTIRNEADNGLENRRGAIAMARQLDTIDSSTSQFFVNVADNPSLDHRGPEPENFGYCVFGEVTEGMDVVDRIAQLRVQEKDGFSKLPLQAALIESARRRR